MVNHIPLSNLCKIVAGSGFPNKYQGIKDGKYPFYKVSDMNLLGNEIMMDTSTNYVDDDVIEQISCVVAPAGTVIFPKIGAAIATNKKRILSKDAIYDNNIVGLVPGENVRAKYLYYYFDSIDLMLFADRGGALPSIRKSTLEKHLVPVPPLDIQDEIISRLDSFTALTAELTAELTARKKQYEFYRDKLLSFDNLTPEENERLGMRWMTLGDISEIYDGVHQTPDYKPQGVKFVSVEDIDNLYSSNKYISEEDYKRDYKHHARKGDLFMTRIGSIGKCTVLTQDEMLAYYVTLALIRPKTDIVSSDYLKHIIESNIGKRELYKRTLIHATPIKINLGDIGKIMLPIPSIEHQNKLTAILNNFEKLTIDLNEGLPAEIEARQKQYEYYRDKLLSFS